MSLRKPSPKSILLSILLFDVVAVATGFVIAAVRGLPVPTYVASAGYMDYLSFAHLLLMALLASLIFVNRLKQRNADKLEYNCFLWASIALGSLLLAVDQLLWLHDNIGTWFVTLLGIQSDSIVDRAGDFVLLSFVVIGLVLVLIFKSEFKKYKNAFPVLTALIPVFILLISLYALTTTTDILNMFMTGQESIEGCLSWL